MVTVSPVVSAVVMGVILGAAVAVLARLGSPRGAWILSHRRYVPGRAEGVPGERSSPLAGIADNTTALTVAFFVLVFGFGTAAVALVGGFGLSVPASLGTVLVGLFAVVLVGYLGVGVYLAARSRGRPYSMAAAQSAAVLGLVALLAIALKLVLG